MYNERQRKYSLIVLPMLQIKFLTKILLSFNSDLSQITFSGCFILIIKPTFHLVMSLFSFQSYLILDLIHNSKKSECSIEPALQNLLSTTQT